MFAREELLKSPEYWFEGEQNEFFRQVSDYMSNENINKTELANRLKVSKGRISQILDGEFNFTLKTLIELSLKIGIIPKIEYAPIEEVIKIDAEKKAALEIEIPFIKPLVSPVKFETIKGDKFFEQTDITYKLLA
jgi:plasmid maintenance system antidote protein VapI